MKVPFSPPDITQADIDGVVEVLRSGWITTGPKTKEFEHMLSKYCGTNKTAALNSATAAMELALRLLGIGPGDEVITSVYTYTASASVIAHVGATPVLIDVDEDSQFMSAENLRKAITERTKAVIPVDIAGIPCDYDAIFQVVKEKKPVFKPNNQLQESIGRIVVLADAAHSFGMIYKGRRSGSIADFSSFSFHAVKNLTTAEGGALTWKSDVFDEEYIYKQLMNLSLHGQNKSALDKTTSGSWEYDILSPAYKCNMADINASLGLTQLSRYAEILEKRRSAIVFYDEHLLNGKTTALNHFSEDYTSSYHLYLLRIDNCSEEKRNELMEYMGQKGISTNVHFKPLPLFTAYRNLGFDIKDFPNAYNVYKNTITMPVFNAITKEQLCYVADVFDEALKRI